MTNKKVRQLILERHRVWLVLIAVLTLLLGLFLGTNHLANRATTNEYIPSARSFTKEYRDYVGDEKISYQEFVRRQKTEYIGDKGNKITFGTSMLFIEPFIIMALVAGVLMMFMDQNSQFNRLLFSSGVARKRILMAKILPYVAVVLLSYLGAAAIIMLVYHFGIPARYLIIDWPNTMLNLVAFVGTLLFAFGLGAMFGTIIGTALPLVLTVAFLGLSGSSFFNQVTQFFHVQKQVWRYLDNAVSYTIIVLVLTMIFLGLTFWFYDRVSMENSGHYLLLEWLRPWVLLAFVIYVPIATGDWLFVGEKAISMGITGIIVLLLGYWYLYRPNLHWHRNRRQSA